MRGAIDDDFFHFLTKKLQVVRFVKILLLRWNLGRSSGLPWRHQIAVQVQELLISMLCAILFFLQKCVSLAQLVRVDLWGASWALQRLPLATLVCDVFAACAKEPRRYALECFLFKKMCFPNSILFFSAFFRFCILIRSQLGSGWCRRALRGAPRTLPDTEKNCQSDQKCLWRPVWVR